MRTIKFRGKDEFTEEWKIGSLVMVEGSPLIIEGEDIEKDEHHFRQASDRPCDVIPESVGQFTGLHDASGKEIYEGDILKGMDNTLYKVVYSENCGVFTMATNNSPVPFNMYQNILKDFDYHVVGNSYDNPELLK